MTDKDLGRPEPINHFYLLMYLHELLHQVDLHDHARSLYEEYFDGHDHTQPLAPIRTLQAFFAVQAMLTAAAAVSRVIWPLEDGRKPAGSPWSRREHQEWRQERGDWIASALGADLRTELDVLKSRVLRDNLEHFDEKLDYAFMQGPKHVRDRLISHAPADERAGPDGSVPLRYIDCSRHVVTVLGSDLLLKDLGSAMAVLRYEARAAIDRLHADFPSLARPTQQM